MKLTLGREPARIYHLADAQDLIKTLVLPRALGEQIDPSLRNEYYQLWDVSQNGWDPFAE